MTIGIAIEVDENMSIKQVENFAKQVVEFAEKLKTEMQPDDSDVSFLTKSEPEKYIQKELTI